MAVKWFSTNSFRKISLIGLGFMLLLWLVSTLFVRRKGEDIVWEIGDSDAQQIVTLIYNPDPFYNFDEQLCKTIATTFSDNNWYAKVLTVRAAQDIDILESDLLIFCSNTYNWAPDTVTKNYLRTIDLRGNDCAAITLGAGTTTRSQRILEETITGQGGKLLGSRSYWLWKPNAEPHVVAPNVHNAKRMAKTYACELIEHFN